MKDDKRIEVQLCQCKNEDKHGETSVMCCNHCGLPVESFWGVTEIETLRNENAALRSAIKKYIFHWDKYFNTLPVGQPPSQEELRNLIKD